MLGRHHVVPPGTRRVLMAMDGIFQGGLKQTPGVSFFGEKIFENCVDSWFCLLLQY